MFYCPCCPWNRFSNIFGAKIRNIIDICNYFYIFYQNLLSFQIFVLPLHPLRGPDGGIGRRAGLKHQWGNPCRFDPGSGYRFRSESAARFIFAALFSTQLFLFCDGGEVFIYSSIQLGQEGFYNLTEELKFLSFSLSHLWQEGFGFAWQIESKHTIL